MSKMLGIMAASVAALAIMFFALGRHGSPPSSGNVGEAKNVDGTPANPVMLFCAASNRAVMEEILADYANEHGRQVELGG